MQAEYTMRPIGYVRSALKYRYESPRQGSLTEIGSAVIQLNPHENFEQALQGLEGFDRIWVVFLFHLNPNWKPMVTPPRHTRKKVGVFATRSPHRPNQIGLSCVTLENIDGLNLRISGCDILDGSPVLDIKPYLPYADSFPDAATGWATGKPESRFSVTFAPEAKKQIEWLQDAENINLSGFAALQLEFEPADTSRKRISYIHASEGEQWYVLAYRTWRIQYRIDMGLKTVTIQRIRSGYQPRELENTAEDKHGDKAAHREFIALFSE
jgi:tRNA-Thr(GGU) m(6)t(6)A37 methyltransferase TsaA